ncbi:PREDICTED: pro-neuregulin-3, membrane-bound isoform-like, partial [Gekko japonicus]|uniref:Pro-neuregulin-3, membrane-bound isoform-like n=1 Tax=Gekko japonicus TaxID=146911 RepID=A0ABM1KRN6_GEKJA
MSEGVAAPPGAAAAAAEAGAAAGGPAAGDGGPDPAAAAAAAREVRCSDCIVWNRQQTWLCVVPLFIGFVGLGLSLMLLKWIVVGSVKEYVPTELMDSKGIEQDPFFLSKPSALPKSMETTTTTTTTTTAGAAATSRTPNRISTRLTTMTKAPTRFPGTRGPIRAGPPRSTTARHTVGPPTVQATAATAAAAPRGTTLLISRPAPGTPGTQPLPLWPTAAYTTSSYKTYLQDSAPSWTLSPFQEAGSSSTTTTAAPEAHTSQGYPEAPPCSPLCPLPSHRRQRRLPPWLRAPQPGEGARPAPQERRPAGPPGLLRSPAVLVGAETLLGNVLQLGRLPHLTFCELARRYRDVFQLRLGMRAIVVLNGEAAIRQVLVQQSGLFAGRPNFPSFRLMSGGKSMAFGRYPERWRAQRRVAHATLRAFSTAKTPGKLLFEQHVVALAAL